MSHKSIAYILMTSALLSMGAASKIYADAQIIIDPITQTISIVDTSGSTNSGNISVITTGTTSTGIKTNTGTTTLPITPISTWVNPNAKSEFENALSRLYFYKITKYQNTGDFRMYDNLTREEAAKMMVESYIAL